MAPQTHFLTVAFPDRQPNTYSRPVAFYKVDSTEAGRLLLELFQQEYGPKGAVFDLKAENGLTRTEVVLFVEAVEAAKEWRDDAYNCTDAPPLV